jgi:hypothetical protein
VLQDKELLAGRSALLAAQRAVAERSAAISQAKQELWEAKRKTAHQSALLDAIAHDIAHVSSQRHAGFRCFSMPGDERYTMGDTRQAALTVGQRVYTPPCSLTVAGRLWT